MIRKLMDSMGVTTTPVLDYKPVRSARVAHRFVARVVLGVVVFAIAFGAVVYGLKARRDIWEWTANVHFKGDVANGFRWGWNAQRIQLFRVYDYVQGGQQVSSISSLDYTPLRLAAVTAWVYWAENWAEPKFTRTWEDSYACTWPMLWGNTVAELISSFLIFVLILMWTYRTEERRDELSNNFALALPPLQFFAAAFAIVIAVSWHLVQEIGFVAFYVVVPVLAFMVLAFLVSVIWIYRTDVRRHEFRNIASARVAFPIQVFWGVCGIAIAGLMYLSERNNWPQAVYLITAPFSILLLERGWSQFAGGIFYFTGTAQRLIGAVVGICLGWYFLNWNSDTWLIPLFIAAPLLGNAFIGIGPAIFGALLFWFNPAVLWNAHAWPQWDIWLMPWFLGAVLLACVDWWFAAGVCLAIGGSLKGQLFLGAPVLFLWPLFQWRINALFRLGVGVLFGTAAIALPWLLLSRTGFAWFVMMACAMGLAAPFALRWKLRWPWAVGLTAAAVLLAWPWASSAPVMTKIACPALLGLVVLARLLPARLLPHVYALAISGAILITMPVFNASSTWFTRGYMYGTERYADMISGNGTYNLPALMQTYFRWPRSNEDQAFLPFIDKPFTFRQQMSVIYGLCAALAGIGAAVHYRRRDTRFLVAMVAPWVIMYCLLPQMMGRYLVWGAAVSALLAGSGVGLALLGVLISLISLNGMVQNQNGFYSVSEIISPALQRQIFALRPHLGWGLLLIAAILLYYAFVPRTKATLM